MHTRARSVAVIGAVAALGVVAVGCGSSGGTTSAADGDEAVSATTVAAAAGGSSTTSTTATASGSSGPTTVPVSIEHRDGDSSAGYMAVVEASIGGGDQVRLVLDTGSAGLVVASDAVGSDVTAPSSPSTTTVDYVGSSVAGEVEQATVSIGGVSTAAPVDVLVADCSGGCSGAFYGTDGILGIAASDDSGAVDPYSPLLQLPSPYDQGFTLDLTSGGGTTGTLVIGPVAPPSGAVALQLGTSTPAATYPSGMTAWDKDPRLCWTIDSGTACGLTDLDIGMADTQVSTSVPGAQSSGDYAGGTAISVAPSEGASPIWTFTTGSTASDDQVVANGDLGDTAFNTGIAFFFANVVAYDMANGQILVSPAGS